MSEVLYRKYRPKNFKELIGQFQVKDILSKVIDTDNPSHSYIFSGPRGTGKTTSARILAKALNCTAEKDKPCGICDSCKSIDKSSHFDVIEIDAASFRGIDEIRKIRDRVSYRPSMGKYKIYIIDEFHMLTREAFNALLKTLEEPPENVVFILATTNIEKVPDTILSRCQIYYFKNLSISEIAAYLKKILISEEIEFEEKALERIAYAANGGMRDAVNILERVIALSDTVDFNSVKDILGLLPDEMIEKYIDSYTSNNLKNLIEFSQDVLFEGYSFENLIDQSIEKLKKKILKGDISKKFGSELVSDFWYIYKEVKFSENKKSIFDTLNIFKSNEFIKKYKPSSCEEEIEKVIIKENIPEIKEEIEIKQVTKVSENSFIDKIAEELFDEGNILEWAYLTLSEVEETEKNKINIECNNKIIKSFEKNIKEIIINRIKKYGKEVFFDNKVDSNSLLLENLPEDEKKYVSDLIDFFGAENVTISKD